MVTDRIRKHVLPISVRKPASHIRAIISESCTLLYAILSFHLHNHHCIDRLDSTTLIRRKIHSIEDVVEDTLVVDDVVMADVVVIDTIDDHVRFGTNHRLDFDHQS